MSQPPPEHPPSPVDILRDKRAMLDTGTGPIAFVVVYAIWGLKTAAIVAIALGVVMAVERVVRKKTVVNVLGGLFVTVISAVIAWRTGKAETYFVPRALIQAGYAIVFAGSAVIRQPITGFLVAALFRAEPGWAKLPAVRRAMTELTLAWAALFGFRAAVYAVLIATGRVGWLAAASVAMGWPAFGLLMFLSYRFVPKRLEQLGAPDPRQPEAPEPAP
ncbi:DUF3159 domain-containing protein [Solirubrobacter ginsenosidimutans]|uniref:DUF3159 domain-containing protein n=1 Tax=Solirubrobacter ginsenosidimutans TaxID=490573 RepID=A0A9X3N3P9_9ACTN|nr:DUF3159 domain-containing protein [Solirubrobacter ginsenosidimutans]MDA0166177.1 DUF3159 domain-containing protein [Solirubrobacter ginsenosidimutans]